MKPHGILLFVRYFCRWPFLAQSACTDNKATDQVARLAFRFLQRHHRGNQSLFTNAMLKLAAGKLSRVTKAFLRFLI
jgi:hypothetical protein